METTEEVKEDKKKWRKRNYWKKGLSRYLVEKIQELDPTLVQFETKAPEIVKCTIVLKDAVGKGVAICSILDEWEFNERKGRNIAAGRAVRALVNKTSDEVIRSQNFPDTWLLRQARRLLKYNQEECFKSQFGKIQ